MICTERYYLAALNAVYNLSFKKVCLLVEHFGSANKAYEANADYLKNSGAAVIAKTSDDVLLAISNYSVTNIKQRQKLGKPEAAPDIAKAVINMLS